MTPPVPAAQPAQVATGWISGGQWVSDATNKAFAGWIGSI
jgi:hypothetical protein